MFMNKKRLIWDLETMSKSLEKTKEFLEQGGNMEDVLDRLDWVENALGVISSDIKGSKNIDNFLEKIRKDYPLPS